MSLDLPPPAAALTAASPPRSRGRPRKAADTRDDGNRRQDLIRHAARLFRKRGFDSTSTRDIAAAVGMQSGSPFYHFKSKGELLGAVMQEGMQSAIARQAQALERVGAAATPREQLRTLVRNHFDILLGRDSDFIPVMLYEARSLTAAQRRELADLQARYEAAWLPVLAALHARGALRADVKLARLLMFGALNWSVQWFRARQGATLDELTQAALDLFLGPDNKGKA